MEKHLTEEYLKSELVFKGKFLEYHVDQVRLPNDHITTREYLHHPGAVAAVPLMNTGEVILVKQFRYPTRQVLLEIPAGKLEPGESPENCARRELIEEIGFEPGRLTHLTSIWTTPGFTDEIIHLYLATDLKPCPGQADSDEFIETVKISRDELLKMLKSHNLIDGKTSLALTLMELRQLWECSR